MEKWSRWQPSLDTDLSGKFVINSMKLSYDGWIVGSSSLKNNIEIEIILEYAPDAYRYTPENDYFIIFSDMKKIQRPDFYADWSFFKIENSEYAAWASEKSATWSNSFNLDHFCIVGNNQVLDILTTELPTIKVLR